MHDYNTTKRICASVINIQYTSHDRHVLWYCTYWDDHKLNHQQDKENPQVHTKEWLYMCIYNYNIISMCTAYSNTLTERDTV